MFQVGRFKILLSFSLIFSWTGAVLSQDNKPSSILRKATADSAAEKAKQGRETRDFEMKKAIGFIRKDFAKHSRIDFEAFKTSEDDTLALAAAWCQIELSTGNDRRTSSHDLVRFLGYAEGRLRMGLTAWWTTRLLSTYSADPKIPYPANRKYIDVEFHPEAPLPKRALRRGGALRLKAMKNGREQSIDLYTDVILKVKHDEPIYAVNYTIAFQKHNSLVFCCALPTHNFKSYKLICFDLKTSSVRWNAPIWNTGVSRESGGVSDDHQIQIRIVGRRLALFGIGQDFYLNVLNIETGELLALFSSAFSAARRID